MTYLSDGERGGEEYGERESDVQYLAFGRRQGVSRGHRCGKTIASVVNTRWYSPIGVELYSVAASLTHADHRTRAARWLLQDKQPKQFLHSAGPHGDTVCSPVPILQQT